MNISREKLAENLKKVFPLHNLEDKLLSLLLEELEVVYFPDGKMIYREESLAEAFYIVLEGEVDILKEVHRSLIYKNVIKPFFSFGEDIFSENVKRRTSARAIGDVVLIKIGKQSIFAICSEDAYIKKSFSQVYSSYECLLSKRFKKKSDETIFYISHLHPLPLILKVITTIILVLGLGTLTISFYNNGLFSHTIFQWIAGLLSLAGLIYMGWSYFEWTNDLFFITDKRVHNTKRVNLAFEEKQDTPLSAIEFIQVRSSLLGRSMNYGVVDIKTFTGETRIPAVPNVGSVQQMIEFLAARRIEVIDLEERAAFQDAVRQRINGSEDSGEKSFVVPENNKVGFNDQDGPDEESNVQNKELEFRTHWTVLFSKVFIPAFIFIGLFLINIFLRLNEVAMTKHPIFNWIMAGSLFVIICWFVYQLLDWRNDRFIITDDMLIDVDKKPFGTEEKRTAPINRIQSIRFKKKGIFGLIFNFGTVFIRIGDEELTFDNIHRPSKIQEILFDAKERNQEKEDLERKTRERDRAVDWIDSYHRLMQEEKEDDTEDI